MSAEKYDKPHRLKNFDDRNFNYSAMGSYMATITTLNRNPVLSEVVCPGDNPEAAATKLSHIGRIVEEYILQIPEHYKNVYVDSYVIMPDHVHILLTFADEEVSDKYERSRLSTIIRTLKTLITKRLGFSVWQLDYYDTVAFSEKAYDAMRNYIIENPYAWHMRQKAEPEMKK